MNPYIHKGQNQTQQGVLMSFCIHIHTCARAWLSVWGEAWEELEGEFLVALEGLLCGFLFTLSCLSTCVLMCNHGYLCTCVCMCVKARKQL